MLDTIKACLYGITAVTRKTPHRALSYNQPSGFQGDQHMVAFPCRVHFAGLSLETSARLDVTSLEFVPLDLNGAPAVALACPAVCPIAGPSLRAARQYYQPAKPMAL